MGKEKNIVGIDIEWNVPINPDIKIEMKENTSLEETGNLIYKKIKYLYKSN